MSSHHCSRLISVVVETDVVFTCSVKRVVGVEDCGEEAKGESTDAKRHVKTSIPKTLEHLEKTQR